MYTNLILILKIDKRTEKADRGINRISSNGKTSTKFFKMDTNQYLQLSCQNIRARKPHKYNKPIRVCNIINFKKK